MAHNFDYGCKLPKGTIVFESNQAYRYKAFSMDMFFRVANLRFDWDRYIDFTLYRCLKGTIDKFMKVV